MAARILTASGATVRCSFEQFQFSTTRDLEPADDIIGQTRAVTALRFGLGLTGPGYNIYVNGPTGTGRTTYTSRLVRAIAGDRPTPDDWCYVFQFANPNRPLALRLKPGQGKQLRDDLDDALSELQSELPRAFDTDAYEQQRSAIVQQAQEQAASLVSDLDQQASQAGFAVVRTASGLATVPAADGKPMSNEQLEALDEETRARLNERGSELRQAMSTTMRRIREHERAARQQLKELDSSVATSVVKPMIDDLKQRYGDAAGVTDYLQAWQDDVIANVNEFMPSEPKQPQLPFLPQQQTDFFHRYRVNLLVDNSEQTGAPVVFESNPTYFNLFGKIEYRGSFGTLTTDFTMIKPGAVHRAAGGYLVLHAVDLLVQPLAWDALKRALKNRELKVENPGDPRAELMQGLSPRPIPLDVKVVLIGPPDVYQLLHALDSDFRKLFKVRADFDVEMDRTPVHENQYAEFIASICDRESLPHFDRTAVGTLVEYGSRLVGDQKKLSTRFNEILDIVFEAGALAAGRNTDSVTGEDVRLAIANRRQRSDLAETRLLEMIERGQILLDVDGTKSGQVNGLAVHQQGDFRFGRPSRITVRTYASAKGIVDIERESNLGGSLHSKGVLILGGYLGQQYSRETPLTLGATICMEQSYSGVEGDSASAGELLTLLSSIAGVPLRQDIAITGSVNQHGRIQPVGGVTEKVEGFFAACRLKGLTGKQGVVIPRQNEANLVLRDEVVEAIDRGEFHVWSIAHIDEGIELLSGIEAGSPDEDGKFPEDSLHALVSAQLSRWSRTLRPRQSGEDNSD